MKTKVIALLTFIISITTLFIACEDTETTGPNNDIDSVYSYLTAGSNGDIIKIEIYTESRMFKYFNETTNQSDSAIYILSENTKLAGIYELEFSGTTYYLITKPGEFIATNAPCGSSANKLCFGLSSDNNLSTYYSAADLAGKYIYINYGDLSDEESWGGYEINIDGSYTWNIGPNEEKDFDVNKHFAGGGSGTWAVSNTDSSRIVFSENEGDDYKGTIYPNKAMIISNGVGKGFSLGISYPMSHISQNSVSGNYTFIDITTDGETGIGTYSIPETGNNFTYYVQYDGASGIDEGISDDFAEVPQVNNMFKTSGVYEEEIFWNWFLFLPGEIMLHFCTGEEAGLVSYGIGINLDN